MVNKIIAFCPADKNNDKFFHQMENSLRKFHTEEELPLIRVEGHPTDPQFWYRATPLIGGGLLKEYDTVVKLDADQIICGKLDDTWQGDFDMGLVLNDPSYPLGVWDITHPKYFNNGYVVMKSKKFVDHWLRLCMSPHFDKYQFKEQDLLNLLASDYFDYKIRNLDDGESIYGESGKPVWATSKLVDDKIMVGEKEIKVIHFGGGAGDPSKGNYRIRFPKEVVTRIEWLIK